MIRWMKWSEGLSKLKKKEEKLPIEALGGIITRMCENGITTRVFFYVRGDIVDLELGKSSNQNMTKQFIQAFNSFIN